MYTTFEKCDHWKFELKRNVKTKNIFLGKYLKIRVMSFELILNTGTGAICKATLCVTISWQCRHNRREGVSNHQPPHCLLKRLFRRRPKKTSKLRVTGLYSGNSPVSGEFLAQMAIWWHHHDVMKNSSLSSTNQSCKFLFVQAHITLNR